MRIAPLLARSLHAPDKFRTHASQTDRRHVPQGGPSEYAAMLHGTHATPVTIQCQCSSGYLCVRSPIFPPRRPQKQGRSCRLLVLVLAGNGQCRVQAAGQNAKGGRGEASGHKSSSQRAPLFSCALNYKVASVSLSTRPPLPLLRPTTCE